MKIVAKDCTGDRDASGGHNCKVENMEHIAKLHHVTLKPTCLKGYSVRDVYKICAY